MIREVKFKEVKKSESGKTIVVLKESALEQTKIIEKNEGMQL